MVGLPPMSVSVTFHRLRCARKLELFSLTPCITRTIEEDSASLSSVLKGGSGPWPEATALPEKCVDLKAFPFSTEEHN
jgi:hypothetical protein